MMDSGLRNLVRQEVARLVSGTRRHGRVGLISSYDPKTHSAKVKLMPGGQETGWLTIGATGASTSSGFISGPQVDDQVRVDFLEGDLETGIISQGVFSDKNPPPNVPSGEMHLFQKSVSTAILDNNGHITLTPHALVNLGGTGGPRVARIGDKVDCCGCIGTIITGSSKVTAVD
jgi:hypothetical protein